MISWVDLDGTANTRDVGGLPAQDGARVRPHRLLRSDNLQDLSGRDVQRLREEYGVRAVADLRTPGEVDSEGPAPLDRVVEVHRLSLHPVAGRRTDLVIGGDADARAATTASELYLRYLADRPDSVLAALRLVAHADGATIVHCAAGKDRTGVVVALALDEVGVQRDAIVTDYAASADRAEQLIARLSASPTYSADVSGKPPSYHMPRSETMELFLTEIGERFGGTSSWLRAQGWTDADAEALRTALLSVNRQCTR